MSLERELVFDLMSNGASKEAIPEIVKEIQSPELDRKYGVKFRLNSKKIDVATNQYQARELLKKRKDYKITFKNKLKDLIEKEKKRIEDTYPNLLSFKIGREFGPYVEGQAYKKRCINCDEEIIRVYAEIEYVNDKKEIPVKRIREENLFEYCEICGHIHKD